MSGLKLVITNAGRAALVNALNTGTNARTITHIGVTATAFAATTSSTSLPGERKRLTTFAGDTVARDTVHVTLRDESDDSYSLRGFALYLDDGTLFALYGQSAVILEKSAQAMLLLSADVVLANIAASTLVFGNTNWINPPATTERQGVVELSTPSESIAGLDSTRAMTPAADKAAMDARLGAAAPTSFAKSLLSLATATAIRLALGLKSAALKDEGSGNGLDVDLLDGQHGSYYRAWANMTGVPSAFTPAAHSHPWSNLTSVPSTASRWPSWSEVTDKPLRFTAESHVHNWSEIIAKPDTATRWPNWTEISGKPRLLIDRYAESGSIPSSADLNTYTASGLYHQNSNASAETGTNYPTNSAGMLHVYAAQDMVYQTYQTHADAARWHRSCYKGSWSVWRDEQNSATFKPTTKVDTTTNIAAGSGLTGGGTLNQGRTIALGTPSTLSGSTTNAVTSTSHTHALSANLSAWDAIEPSAKADTSHMHSQYAVTGQTANFATLSGSLVHRYGYFAIFPYNNTSHTNPDVAGRIETYYSETTYQTPAWVIWGRNSLGNLMAALDIRLQGELYAADKTRKVWHAGDFLPTAIPTQSADFLVSKINSIIGIGNGGDRNGGLANYSNGGIGDVGLFSERADGRIRLRPNGRLSGTGELAVTTTGATWGGFQLLHTGIFNPIAQPASNITSGTFANARIAVGSVTQHQAALAIGWGQLTGVPDSFTPDSHTHAAGDITSGTFNVARIPALSISKTTGLQDALNSKAALSGADFTGAVTARSFGISSDRRLKTDIREMKDCLDTVMAMRPKRWQWKDTGIEDNGFIAQEHAAVMPAAVMTGEDGLLYVQYGRAEANIVGAIQEIAERLREIEIRLGMH